MLHLRLHGHPVVQGDGIHVCAQVNAVDINTVPAQQNVKLGKVLLSLSLSGHEESRAASSRSDIKNLHPGLEVELGYEILRCHLPSRADKSPPEYLLVSRDTIS